MYVVFWLSVYLCTTCVQCQDKPERVMDPHRAGVTDDTSLHVGSENQTCVLWKSYPYS